MEKYKFNIAQLFTPLLVWCCLLIMPVFSNAVLGVNLSSIWYINIITLLLGAVFLYYLDYYLFVDDYATRKKWWLFVLINIVLIAILIFLCIGIIMLLLQSNRLEMSRNDITLFFVGGSGILILTALFALAVRASKIAHLNGLQVAEMARLQAQTELQGLKSQINPHFLFNTLNNIYSLIALDSTRAQKAVHDLSHLLRYVIYDSSEEKVSLKKEIGFIEDYIKLERLRLGESVRLEVDIPKAVPELEIAPLILVPFVENAFKHGISYTEASSIEIVVRINVRTLICSIRNTNHPVKKSRNSSGIGIQNTIKRLSLLYPDRYSLRQGLSEDGLYDTELEITL